MGIHARITWLHRKLYFKDCNIFLDLSPCDPAKPDKSVKKSAEKLVEFIHDKMNLDNQHSGMTFTSDCAIYKGVIPVMETLGIDLKLNHLKETFWKKSMTDKDESYEMSLYEI